MAELSYPTAGGGSITDARYEALMAATMPTGLIGSPSLPDLVYADSTGRQVKVQPSRAAIVRGFRWETDGAGIVRAIAANASGQPRIDLAVLRLNRSDWTVTFQIIQGTPAASPVAPTYAVSTGSTGTYEMPLAQIYVANGAATLTAGNVTTLSWYIGPQTTVGTSSALGPLPSGQITYEHNTGVGRLMGHVFSENGSRVSLPADNTGWDNPNVFITKRNGFVHMNAVMRRVTALNADTNSQMFVVPATHRPQVDMAMVGINHSTKGACRIYLVASTGMASITEHGGFAAGQWITIHPAIWPAS